MVVVAGVVVAFAMAGGAGSLARAQATQSSPAVADEADEVGDPLEPVNRFLFGFNEIFQMVILRPATGMYQHLIPPAVREAVGNVIDNLKTPVILANDILQGEADRAAQTVERFVINTTLGVGGVMDPATDMGVIRHNEDFGQTLAVWGVGEGFYLVLPFFGPSNPRDAVGKLLVDGYFDPLGLYLENTDRDAERYARMAVEGVDEYGGVMDELEQVKKTSVDYYAAIRSMYRQKRKSEISNGKEVDLPPIPDLGGGVEDGMPSAAMVPVRDELVSLGWK